MHECPSCGMACDCDGEDTWGEGPFYDCDCLCEIGADTSDDDFPFDEEKLIEIEESQR